MAELFVDVDGELPVLPQKRAARNGCSVEEEHREILHFALADEPRALSHDAFKQLAKAVRAVITGRLHTPSEILQRQGRDER